MYDLPSSDEVSKVVIDENVINGDTTLCSFMKMWTRLKLRKMSD